MKGLGRPGWPRTRIEAFGELSSISRNRPCLYQQDYEIETGISPSTTSYEGRVNVGKRKHYYAFACISQANSTREPCPEMKPNVLLQAPLSSRSTRWRIACEHPEPTTDTRHQIPDDLAPNSIVLIPREEHRLP